MKLQETLASDQSRLDWLSQERENLITEFDECKTRLEVEAVTNEALTRKNQALEREINEQRNFLSKELNARTDETLQLMRQVDHVSADLKKLQTHTTYIEQAKEDLEVKHLSLQKEHDSAQRDLRLKD